MRYDVVPITCAAVRTNVQAFRSLSIRGLRSRDMTTRSSCFLSRHGGFRAYQPLRGRLPMKSFRRTLAGGTLALRGCVAIARSGAAADQSTVNAALLDKY